MKSGNLNFLELSGPLQACNGTALPLHLPLCLCICVIFVCYYLCLYVELFLLLAMKHEASDPLSVIQDNFKNGNLYAYFVKQPLIDTCLLKQFQPCQFLKESIDFAMTFECNVIETCLLG